MVFFAAKTSKKTIEKAIFRYVICYCKNAAMTSTTTMSWEEANRYDLVVRIKRLRVLLEHALHPGQEPVSVPPVPLDPAFGLSRLAILFGLSAFETDILLLCAAVELDSSMAELCARLNADPRRPQPSFGMAMTVLPQAHWNALTPAAPLRFWQLVVPMSGELLARASLLIDAVSYTHLDVYKRQVSEFTALPELDASANAVAIQSLVLQNEGWERDQDVTEPTEPLIS